MNNISATSMQEQLETMVETMALGVAAYHAALLKAGLPNETIEMLVTGFAHMWVHKHLFNESPYKHGECEE